MEVATADNKPEIIRAGGMESELAKSHSSVFTSRQLPRRVSVSLPSSELTLCEYCFPDESEEVWSFSLPVGQSSVRSYIIMVMCAAGLQRKSG